MGARDFLQRNYICLERIFRTFYGKSSSGWREQEKKIAVLLENMSIHISYEDFCPKLIKRM